MHTNSKPKFLFFLVNIRDMRSIGGWPTRWQRRVSCTGWKPELTSFILPRFRLPCSEWKSKFHRWSLFRKSFSTTGSTSKERGCSRLLVVYLDPSFHRTSPCECPRCCKYFLVSLYVSCLVFLCFVFLNHACMCGVDWTSKENGYLVLIPKPG